MCSSRYWNLGDGEEGQSCGKKLRGSYREGEGKKVPPEWQISARGEKGERKGTSLLVILSREYKRRAVQAQRRGKRGKRPSSSPLFLFSPRRRLLK